MLKKNQILTLDIVDLNNLGYGVAREEGGSVVFVSGAVTGDKVSAKIIKVNKRYSVARLESIITPSPWRLDTELCSAPKSCGGCVYRYVTRESELEMKRKYVESLMRREGLSSINVLPTLAPSPRTHYRNKAQYPVRQGKNGATAGFFASGTHKIVSGTDCALEPPIFSEIVNTVLDFINGRSIPAYDEESGKGIVRHIYIRRAERTEQIMVCIVINADTLTHAENLAELLCSKFPCVTNVLLNINKENTNVITGSKYVTVKGVPYIEDVLCGKRFRISPDSFWQVNTVGAECIYGIAKELADLDGTQNLLDLYCGTGTIGLSMADKCNTVTGVEIVESAVNNARLNASLNEIKNAGFFCADASDVFTAIPDDRHFDVVILDPPRKGTTPELIKAIADRNIPKVVYISCGPDTLARDISIFKSYGYAANTIQPVDMFPMTGHVESLVCLTRK